MLGERIFPPDCRISYLTPLLCPVGAIRLFLGTGDNTYTVECIRPVVQMPLFSIDFFMRKLENQENQILKKLIKSIIYFSVKLEFM